MKLSNNFTLQEMCASATADAKSIENVPDMEQVINLQKLCIRLLQPLRDSYGEAFFVNSGFRNPELNKAVGGVPTSQHLKGQAADVRVRDPRKLLAKLLETELDFDQAILYPTFLHLSFNAKGNRKQVLYAKGVKL